MAATRRCISSPAARPGRSETTAARQRGRRRDVGSVRQLARLRPGHAGAGLGIPGTNDQGRGDPRYAGLPEFRTGFTALGNTPTWTPTYRDEGTTSLSSNVTKVAANHTTSESGIASTTCTWTTGSRTGQSSRPLRLRRERHEDVRHRLADRELLQPPTRRSCSASSARAQELSSTSCSPAASGSTRCSSATAGRVNPKLTLDLGLRWEYYPIMSRADRQIEMLDRNTLDVLIGGVGGNPKNMGLVGAEGLIRAASRRRLSSQRQDGVAQRLWRHARRARHVGAGGVPRRLQLSARAERA